MRFNRAKILSATLLVSALFVVCMLEMGTNAQFIGGEGGINQTMNAGDLRNYGIVPMDGGSGFKIALGGYNPDGSNTVKFLSDNPSSRGEGANDMVVDFAGRFTIAGWGDVGGNYQFLLTRYISSTIDTDFGDNGYVLTNFSLGTDEVASSIALDYARRIVVGGAIRRENGALQFALARYRMQDGALDTAFGSEGKKILDFPGAQHEVLLDIALDGQKRIIAVGAAWVDDHYEIAVARLTEDGELDSSFGNGGRVLTNFALVPNRPQSIGAVEAKVLNSGSIVVAAQTMTGMDREFAFAIYDSQGSLQLLPTKVIQFNGGNVRINAMAVRGDRIVVAGGVDFLLANGIKTDFFLMKFDTNGTIMTGFGNGGIVQVDFAISQQEEAHAVGFDSDGNIIAAGFAQRSTGGDVFALAKMTSAGALMSMFDGDGRKISDIEASQDERIRALYISQQYNWMIAAGVGK